MRFDPKRWTLITFSEKSCVISDCLKATLCRNWCFVQFGGPAVCTCNTTVVIMSHLMSDRVGCALCPVTKKLWKLKQKLNPTLIIWTCVYILKFRMMCLGQSMPEMSMFEIFFSTFSPGLIHFVCVCVCARACVCVCTCVCARVCKILFPTYIGVNGAVESYSCRLEADNSKSVNPTDKVDTLWERRQVWLQLWKISLFLLLLLV